MHLHFINDVVEDLGEAVTPSLFADDIAIWSKHENIEVATSRVQQAVDKISQLSKTWLLTLSIGKCEASLFTIDNMQGNLKPTIKIDGIPISYNENPTFLGVTYDRRLTFSQHVTNVCTKAKKRIMVLKCLSGTDWGCEL